MAKVLVIDDEIDVCSELAEILEQFKHVVHCTDKAKDGIEKAKKETYDVIFLDMLMPKMEGSEALVEIKKISEAPVVIMSGYLAEDMELQVKRAGAYDCLSKPFKIKEIQNIISHIEKEKQKSK